MSEETIDIFEYFNNLSAESQPQLQLLVLTKNFELYRTNIVSAMDKDLKECFLAPVSTFVLNGADNQLTIEDYDPQYKPDDPVLWKIGANDVPNYDEVLQRLALPPDELEVFNDDVSDIGELSALLLRIFNPAEDQKDLIVFQHISQNYILKDSNKLRMYFNGKSFGKVEEQANFQISKNNDLFAIGEALFILDKSAFERLFNYVVKKQEVAEQKLSDIENKYSGLIKLPSGEDLASLLQGDKAALNKLQRLDESMTLTLPVLQSQIEHYNLGLKINKDNQLEVNTKKDAKVLIGILNKDYLASEIDGERFAVQSKKKTVG